MKRLASKLIGILGRMLHRMGVMRPAVFIEMDGGICSQMHFYMVGRMLEQRGERVVYELKWFDECGLDTDGRFPRCFDLTRMFPSLPIEICSSRLRSLIYRKSFPRLIDYFNADADPLGWMDIKGPAYLIGYFHDPEELYGPLFREAFNADTNLLDEENRKMLREIETAPQAGDACAVHVRRGDLSEYHEVYGAPATTGYFREAFSRVVMESSGRVRFFIFSDEPDWCRTNLVPALKGFDIRVVDINGSDRGWCDMMLMSRCRHHVTSQGSLGKYGALLRPEALSGGLVIIPPQSAEWLARFRNAEIISC